MSNQIPMRFDGPAYDKELDQARLTGQIQRVFNCMVDGRWRTLSKIAAVTGDPEASISAQLRHLRKARFGSHYVNRRRRGGASGLHEYQLIINESGENHAVDADSGQSSGEPI